MTVYDAKFIGRIDKVDVTRRLLQQQGNDLLAGARGGFAQVTFPVVVTQVGRIVPGSLAPLVPHIRIELEAVAYSAGSPAFGGLAERHHREVLDMAVGKGEVLSAAMPGKRVAPVPVRLVVGDAAPVH